MLKFKMLFAVALWLTVVITAGAQDAVRVWQGASGEGFAAFQEAVTTSGWGDEKGVRAEALGKLAFDFAKRQGHLTLVPAKYRNESGYTELFLRWNGVAGETVIPYDYFKTKGQYVGWWLPVTESPEAKVAALTEKLAALQSQLDAGAESREVLSETAAALRSEVESIRATSYEVSTSLQTLRDGVNALAAGKLTEEMVASIKKVVTDSIGDLTGLVEQAQRDAATAVQLATAANEKSEAVAKTTEGHGTWLIVLTAVAVGTGLYLLVFGVRQAGRNSTVAKSLGSLERAFWGTTNQPGIHKEVEKLKQRVEEVDERSRATQADVRELTQTVSGYFFEEAAVSETKLKALPIGGSLMLALHCTDGDLSDLKQIKIVRTGENEVTLEGVLRQKGQQTPASVALRQVAATIHRAGKADRVVGVKPPVVRVANGE